MDEDVNADLIGYEFMTDDLGRVVVAGTSESCGVGYVRVNALDGTERHTVRSAGLVRTSKLWADAA